ncbi:MAG: hypothetical protein WCL29_06030, partial [Pseudomonadota bacterium]
MFNKIFKTNDSDLATGNVPAEANANKTAIKKGSPEDNTDWQTKLLAASKDDSALLAIAKENAPLKVRQAAVEAMQTEEGIKAAEREFRDHDRRIHREAKQKLEATEQDISSIEDLLFEIGNNLRTLES